MTKRQFHTSGGLCIVTVAICVAVYWSSRPPPKTPTIPTLTSPESGRKIKSISPKSKSTARINDGPLTSISVGSDSSVPELSPRLDALKLKYLNAIKAREAKTLSVVAHYTHNNKEIAVVKFLSCSQAEFDMFSLEIENDIKAQFKEGDRSFVKTKLDAFLKKNIDIKHPYRGLMVVNPLDEKKPPEYTLATSSFDNVISERRDGTIGIKTGAGSLSFLSGKEIQARYDFAMSVSETN